MKNYKTNEENSQHILGGKSIPISEISLEMNRQGMIRQKSYYFNDQFLSKIFYFI